MQTLQRLQATERCILAQVAEPVDFGDYAVSKSEQFSNWYQANMIEIREPSGRSFADWQRVFHEHFDPAIFRHMTFYLPDTKGFESVIEEMESARAEDARSDVPAPLSVEWITYMFVTDINRCPPVPDGFEVRPIESAEDWSDLTDFAVEETREAPWFTTEQAVREYLDVRRQATKGLGVNWLRLCRTGEREILSRLGLFDHNGISRLQSVGTAARHRRQGFASALLGHAIRVVLEERKTDGLALTVESGTNAHAMYTAVGFKPIGQELWVMRYPRAPL